MKASLNRSLIRQRRLSSYLVALAGVAAQMFALAGNADADRPVKSILEIRRQFVVVQKYDLSCGAAALATILDFEFGERLTERQVAAGLMRRNEYINDPTLVRNREGFSLLDLKRYVESRGYRGTGYGKLSWEDILAKAPMIVPTNMNGYHHFVIFRGVIGNRVVLADPAWGNRTMSVDAFRRIWVEYPQIGRVGFTVERPLGAPPLTLLAPRHSDLVLLN